MTTILDNVGQNDKQTKTKHYYLNAILEILPNEQDRKATLGCLAACLNMIYQHQLVVSKTKTTSDKKKATTNGKVHEHRGEKEKGDKGNQQPKSPEQQEHGSSSSSSRTEPSSSSLSQSTKPTRTTTSTTRTIPPKNQRTQEFQEELLFLSAELLFLSPEYATMYLPSLDSIVCHNDDDEGDKCEKLLLDPFLESLSSQEAAFQCLSLLLFRFLLVSSGTPEETTGSEGATTDNQTGSSSMDQTKKTIVGYDARVRYVFKYLAVSILSYFDMKGQNYASSNNSFQLQNYPKKIEKQEDKANDKSKANEGNKENEKARENEENRGSEMKLGEEENIEEEEKVEKKEKDENRAHEGYVENEETEDEVDKVNKNEQEKDSANIERLKTAKSNATLKFKALEDTMAERLSRICQWVEENHHKIKKEHNNNSTSLLLSSECTTKQKSRWVRGMKVGAAGVAAGAIFAITGGMAAPAIAAGIAALTGAGAFAHLCISLVTFPAATATLFGVGGGISVANKMNTRTKGLSGFNIEKVVTMATPALNGEEGDSTKKLKAKETDGAHLSHETKTTTPALSRTVCISGWLLDEHDFQRPFGVTPQVTDKHELLCRFCSIYAPEVVPECKSILKDWEGKEDELWKLLRTSYGKDPDTLLPLSGPRQETMLSKDENLTVDTLIGALGFPIIHSSTEVHEKDSSVQDDDNDEATLYDVCPIGSLLTDLVSSPNNNQNNKSEDTDVPHSSSTKKNKVMSESTIRTYKAWDFQAEFGGEQYIASWDTKLLLELSRFVQEIKAELAKTAAEKVLQKTILASLMAAVALPSALLSYADYIDDQWYLVAERADEAGIVLAHSLLDSRAGHRPVTLVGYSFGARIIVSCLQELSKHQVLWENQQQDQQQKKSSNDQSLESSSSSSSSSCSEDFDNNKKQICLEREPASIVEDVVLMGCSASVTSQSWTACRRVVAGRLINCYSKNDWTLALLYRYKNVTNILNPPAGIVEVNHGVGVENYDVSALVLGHSDYCHSVKDILRLVGLDQPRVY